MRMINMNKTCFRFRNTVSHEIDFPGYGPHRDQPLAWELKYQFSFRWNRLATGKLYLGDERSATSLVERRTWLEKFGHLGPRRFELAKNILFVDRRRDGFKNSMYRCCWNYRHSAQFGLERCRSRPHVLLWSRGQNWRLPNRFIYFV